MRLGGERVDPDSDGGGILGPLFQAVESEDEFFHFNKPVERESQICDSDIANSENARALDDNADKW